MTPWRSALLALSLLASCATADVPEPPAPGSGSAGAGGRTLAEVCEGCPKDAACSLAGCDINHWTTSARLTLTVSDLLVGKGECAPTTPMLSLTVTVGAIKETRTCPFGTSCTLSPFIVIPGLSLADLDAATVSVVNAGDITHPSCGVASFPVPLRSETIQGVHFGEGGFVGFLVEQTKP